MYIAVRFGYTFYITRISSTGAFQVTPLISWFSRHKLFTLASVGIYFSAVVLGHELVSKVSVWVENIFTRVVYNNIIAILSIFLSVIFSFVVFNKLKKEKQRTLKIIYWCFTAIVAAVAFRTLLVNNIESIHFVQYAILSLPVFALTKSFGETVFWITLLGAVDEAYQYFILYDYAKDIYFDFNDIILNLIGGGIGVVVIYTLLGREPISSFPSSKKWRKTPLIILSVIMACSVALYLSDILRFYPEAGSKALILLSRVPAPDQFWITLEWGKTYHVLSPFEGTFLVVILISMYAFLDYKTCTKHLSSYEIKESSPKKTENDIII